MIPYSKTRKAAPSKAAMMKAEAKERPADEARESQAMQRLEARMGIDKTKGGK
jgi:hypothetical protein